MSAFFRTDRSRNLVKVCSGWSGIPGYDSADDQTRKESETRYYDPLQRREILEALHREGSVRNFKVMLKRRDGTPQFVGTTSRLYLDENGIVPGVEGYYRSILR